METNTNFEAPVTTEDLATFLADLNAKRKAHFMEAYPVTYFPGGDAYEDNEFLGATLGPKFIRVVTSRSARVDAPSSVSRLERILVTGGNENRYVCAAFMFIDRATGNILKTAGFRTPAKGVRGNIRDPHYWLKSVTPHGAAYQR